MTKSRRERVRQRAGGRCEYCKVSDEFDIRTFQLDHVRARKHGGQAVLGNLAYSCLPCNSFKGPNVSAYDPDTDKLVPLFNPRIQEWAEHFDWNGPELIGKTLIGRATIALLRINDADRVEHRRLLADIEQ